MFYWTCKEGTKSTDIVIQIYEGGERLYVGQFKDGKRSGKGAWIYQDGSENDGYFIGEWSDDLPHGKGRMVCNNGN